MSDFLKTVGGVAGRAKAFIKDKYNKAFGDDEKRDIIKKAMVRKGGKMVPLKPVNQQQREDMAAQ